MLTEDPIHPKTPLPSPSKDTPVDQSKKPLEGAEHLSFMNKMNKKLNKLETNQVVLKEKLKATELEIEGFKSKISEHGNDEKTTSIATSIKALEEQRDLIQERIDFADARIKATNALQNGDTSIDSNIIVQLKAYQKTLEGQQRSLDGGVTEKSEEYKKATKKVSNMNILLQQLSKLSIINAVPSSNALGFAVLGAKQNPSVLPQQLTDMQLSPLGYMPPPIIPAGFISNVASLLINPLANYQPGHVVTFSAATTAHQPIPSIPINKLWYPVSTAAQDKTISTYGCFITDATNPPTIKEADTVGQSPEHRHFNVQQRTEGLVMQSKVTMVDQDMVNHMIKMQIDKGNKVIHINGICKQDYTLEQTEKAKEACQMFINTCTLVGVAFSFDEYTNSVIQSQKQQLQRIGGQQPL